MKSRSNRRSTSRRCISGVSGSLDSEVSFASLSKQGRRFVWNAQAAEMISEVMGEDAIDVVRVYVGLESAETETERVALAMRELERTGAFDREWLLVDLPTGTGYVNYAAVSALEMLARGNCATVAMQYAARPSPLSLDRVGEGHNQARLLLDAISERLRDVPREQRPKVVLFGESLGAWTSQDAFLGQGTQGLVDTGVDYAIWIGTPHFSRWKEQVLRDDRTDVEPELIGVFNDIGEWEATPTEQRDAHALRDDHASQRRRRTLRARPHRPGTRVVGQTGRHAGRRSRRACAGCRTRRSSRCSST